MASLREAEEIRGSGGYRIRMDRLPDEPEITIYDASPDSIRALNARLSIVYRLFRTFVQAYLGRRASRSYQARLEQDVAKLQAV